jgi:queuine tRNA-ribosyltransferase
MSPPQAAIKGGLSAEDLRSHRHPGGMLCNTYHLHLRPGDDVVAKMGGLRKFMLWDRPDPDGLRRLSGFSLAELSKIKEEGVTFHSHIDGHVIFMGPEESMQIQSTPGLHDRHGFR